MKLTYAYLILFLIAGCGMHHYPSQSSYDTHGQFGEYSSYALVSHDSLSVQDRFHIEKGIILHMNSLGYQVNIKDPSLYIYYQLYTKSFKLETKDQVPFENWAARQAYFPEEQVKDPQTTQTVVRGPSLFISFYDPELQKEVWKGHVSNVQFANPHKRQAAVQLVLEQYRLMAKNLKKDYSKRVASM